MFRAAGNGGIGRKRRSKATHAKRGRTLNLQIHAITPRIYLGPFLTPERAAYLSAEGVTHVLNVSDTPSVVRPHGQGIETIEECSIVDLTIIPDAIATRCIDLMHAALQSPNAKIYVHCIAGQNRSPTAIWLFFVACGVSCLDARRMIETKSIDAVPGHKSLIDSRLADLAVQHGRELRLSIAFLGL
ncbi:MAG: hypothetical protein C0485_11010 [Pirellula sp.]|nr:hypothetical protein [Pirellula sp.]